MSYAPDNLSQLQSVIGKSPLPGIPTSTVQKGVGLGRSATSLLDSHPRLAIGLFVVVGLALLSITVAAVLLWLRTRKQQQNGTAGITAVSQLSGLHKDRLRDVWASFVRQLPSSLRDAVADHHQFMVLGTSGSGKSTLIGQMTDWQGQSNQFLPSLTSDPLLQIYLGQRLIVQELSAALLQSTTKEVGEMLVRLARAQERHRPLVVVVVLSASHMLDAAPDRIRREAQLVAGKLGLLTKESQAPLLLRLCVTGMDHLAGYSELARFLHSEKQTLSVLLSAQSLGSSDDLLSQVQPLLSKFLVTQPVATFDKVIAFLQRAPQQLRPVLDYVSALRDASGAMRGTESISLYFSSLRWEEQIGNPFQPPQLGTRRLRSSPRRLHEWLGLPIHASLAAAGSILLLGFGIWTILRHHGQIQRADGLLSALSDHSTRSQAYAFATGPSGKTESVTRAIHAATEELNGVYVAETKLAPLRFVFQSRKERLRREVADSIRRIYLLPALQRAVEKRSQKLVLEALAAIYASQRGLLGGVLRGQIQEYARQLAIPESVLGDYLQLQVTPHGEPVLTTLPELRSLLPDDQRRILSSPLSFSLWLRELKAQTERPILTMASFTKLRKQTESLRESLTLLGKEREQAILFQLLADESPLDCPRLFGASARTLKLEPHLANNLESFLAISQLILESTDSLLRGSRQNLLDLLRWVNQERIKLDGHQELFVASVDGERFEFETQKWLELLLRTRKWELLGDRSGQATRSRHRRGKRGSSKGLGRSEVVSAQRKLLDDREQLSSDGLPSLRRAHFEQQIAPMLSELDKALGQTGSLKEAEKQALTRLVRNELRRYASRYCQAQTAYFLAYRPLLRTGSQIRAELLSLLRPDASLLQRIHTVVDNTRLSGMEHPLFQPLRTCLAPFAPLAALIVPGKDGTLTALAPYRSAAASLATELSGQMVPSPGEGPAEKGSASKEPNGPSDDNQSDAQTSEWTLGAQLLGRLSPIAKTAVSLRSGQSAHRQQVNQFLDSAGITTDLRKPFLRPFEATYDVGREEIERVAASLFMEDIAPPLAKLFGQFPFAKSAKKDASAEEIERLLHPLGGELWKWVKRSYSGLIEDRQGTIRPVRAAEGELPVPQLPAEFWTTVRRAEHIRGLLFQSDGTAKPLRLMVRPLPIPQPRTPRALQPSLSFLRVGSSEIVGIHQQPASRPLVVDWKNQGVAAVGLEYTDLTTNRKQVQSMEVSDSAWSLHRLLTRAAITEPQASYFQLIRESETSRWSLGFAFDPDPFSLFQVPATGRDK